jgi:hypothetical protein
MHRLACGSSLAYHVDGSIRHQPNHQTQVIPQLSAIRAYCLSCTVCCMLSFEVKHRYMLVCSYSISGRVTYPLRRSRRLIRCSILLQDTHYRHARTRHTTHKPRRSLCLVGWGEACACTWRFPGDLRKGRLPHIAEFEFGSDVIQRRGVSERNKRFSFFLGLSLTCGEASCRLGFKAYVQR